MNSPLNLVASLFDFLEHKHPTQLENAVRVSSKVKRSFAIYEALTRSSLAMGSCEPEDNGRIYFAEFMRFFLIEDPQLEDDEFLLTSLEKIRQEEEDAAV